MDKNTGGRPRNIKSDEDLLNYFYEYKEWTCKTPILVQDFVGKDGLEVYRKKQRPLSLSGFYAYMHREYKMYIHQYFENMDNAYKEYLGICRAIKEEIRQDQIDGGMVGIFNPSITQRLNNLVDKSQVETVEQKLLPDPDGDN